MMPPDQTIPARYRLQFSNQVKSPTFTNNPVDTIKVAIYDTCTKSYISSECLCSSAEVKLTVLTDELWVNKGENWSRSEFNQCVLREREGKGPILKYRSLTILLENGLITIKNIIFNDNSSWTRSGFRLGVVVEGKGEEGYLNGERVREGVSKPFRVLDRHVKDSQKPVLLELTHDVQKIRKIGKSRASLLQSKNIKTVEDFLCWYNNNELELRQILGIKSESDKQWKSMIEHAMKCANEFRANVGPLSPCKKEKIKLFYKLIVFLAGSIKRARMVPPAQCQPFANTSQPQQALVHLMGRNMSLYTNDGPCVVDSDSGSGSSELNPPENDIIEGLAQLEIPHNQVSLEDIFANIDNFLQDPSTSDSFDPDQCDAYVQDFIASLLL